MASALATTIPFLWREPRSSLHSSISSPRHRRLRKPLRMASEASKWENAFVTALGRQAGKSQIRTYDMGISREELIRTSTSALAQHSINSSAINAISAFMDITCPQIGETATAAGILPWSLYPPAHQVLPGHSSPGKPLLLALPALLPSVPIALCESLFSRLR